ncbi:anti-sigma factor [Gordonia sp. X0973]|uniref:anti-sigma factor n=1 Tax=Gordonia sp. X0973 TaxID=2742602 RepID=UPI000F53904A|nr:anti-sigma factor [Gordonia sp. X0973]QKT08053.1 anti-sigma factor [Gordonia sp. X0973]
MPDDSLLDWAALAGLDALGAADVADLDERLRTASPQARADYERALRDTREAMARVSEATATTPPPRLRAAILAAVQRMEATGAGTAVADISAMPTEGWHGRRLSYLAAATVLAVVAGAVGWLIGIRSVDSHAPTNPTAARVFAARDVASRSAPVVRGRATLTYSDSVDAAVLVMNDVPPPEPGTVYQMWLEHPGGDMTPAGTMSRNDVAPSTTAVITGIRDARALVFTVEPQGGSTRPTGVPVAKLPIG